MLINDRKRSYAVIKMIYIENQMFRTFLSNEYFFDTNI